jgi:hypothetical protein
MHKKSFFSDLLFLIESLLLQKYFFRFLIFYRITFGTKNKIIFYKSVMV